MCVKCYNLYIQETFLWCTKYAKPCVTTEHMGFHYTDLSIEEKQEEMSTKVPPDGMAGDKTGVGKGPRLQGVT